MLEVVSWEWNGMDLLATEGRSNQATCSGKQSNLSQIHPGSSVKNHVMTEC